MTPSLITYRLNEVRTLRICGAPLVNFLQRFLLLLPRPRCLQHHLANSLMRLQERNLPPDVGAAGEGLH